MAIRSVRLDGDYWAEERATAMMASIWPKPVGVDTVAMDADDPTWNAETPTVDKRAET